MKTEYRTPEAKAPANQAGKASRSGSKSGLTVTGYIVRNGERIRRIDLPLEEQQRLAEVWTAKAMYEAGFEPVSEQGVI